jgi:UDP-GlcNAc:undecaprenyl-phosphate/decaprenyl-phosphate GlcNAc-1-phosphate transferase
MFAIWWAGAIAFVCVLALTPVVGVLSQRWRLFDPVGPLKIHREAIPRLGGVSIAIGLAAATIFGSLSMFKPVSFAWFAAFALIWLAGLVDDIRGLPPFQKLLAQVGSGVLLWEGGWRLPGHFSTLGGILSVCAIVILFVNAFNFLDGSDGLAAGVTAIIGAAYVAAYGGEYVLGSMVACALMGASLGFLWSNFPPAKIFMGDSGSTVLGFCVAFVSIDFIKHSQARPSVFQWMFPLVVAAVPLMDGIVVVLQRLIRGLSPLQGDRRHYYDKMLQREWSPRSVAAISYAVTALLAVIGLWMIRRDLTEVAFFAVVPVIGLVVAGVKGTRGDGTLRHGVREQAES